MGGIKSKRLLSRLEELASIGARSDGGVCRLAFSDEDLAGREYVITHLRRLGLEIRIDAIGNLFGILEGQTNLPAVMIGSHTDTVAAGGKYDGALGVLAALEAVECIVESGSLPRRSVIVASFVNEEGVRFMPDMMGSLLYCGGVSLEDARSARDTNGVTIGEELDRLKYAGTDTLDDIEVDFFLELHIEQGPVLVDAEIDVGVVTGVQGLSWTEVTVTGAANHAGTTPMERRRDAGEAAGAMLTRLRNLPSQIEGLRLTIGSVTYHPNLVNVIPEEVVFTIDARHPDHTTLKEAEAQIANIIHLAGSETACSVESRSLARVEPCDFSETVIAAVEAAAIEDDLSQRRMKSGAGHDAQILSGSVPSGMIFVPSEGGISHNPTEYTTPENIVNGANVLLHATLNLAGRI